MRFAACATILERMREEGTQPGTTLADAFNACMRFYAEAGYPDEWKLHHQGGMNRLRHARGPRDSPCPGSNSRRPGIRLEPIGNRGEGGGDVRAD
jgi:hypothetical protein